MKIFIDTNVYLDFYRIKEVNPLLKPLIELCGHILVTKQVVNEVLRNRGNLATEILNHNFEKFQFSSSLPDALTAFALSDIDPEISKKIDNIKAETKKINGELNLLSKALSEIFEKTIEHVSKGEDKVSIELQKIFDSAIDNDDRQLKAAEKRKLLGNPPGKKNDPIGDELSWEQILDYAELNKCPIWIVSKDNDFITKSSNGKIFGNPLLLKEVNDRDLPEFQFFNDLPSTLLKFKAEVKPDLDLPSKEELEEAAIAQKQIETSVNDVCGGKHTIEIIQNGRFDLYYCTVCKKTLGGHQSDDCDC